MSPPAFIGLIVRPFVFFKLKKCMIRTLFTHKSPLCIAFCILINTLSVQPFIKGPTVVKHTVQNHLHAALMRFFYYFYKKFIAGFQVLFVSNTMNIFRRLTIFQFAFFQHITAILHNAPNMWVNVIIILDIVFMVGWRHK